MNNKKWGIIGFIAVSLAIISGGIAIFFSITSAVSLKRFLHVPIINSDYK